MQIDLSTIYALLFGTLGVSGALTYWERRYQPRRRQVLAIWTLGYVSISIGCAFSIFPILPSPYHRAPAFLLCFAGYYTMMVGVLQMNGWNVPSGWRIGAAFLAVVSLVLFPNLTYSGWSTFCTSAIAGACAVVGYTLQRGTVFTQFRSRMPAAALFYAHALFYALRIFPFLGVDLKTHPDFFMGLAKLTMFEGVLFAVAAPMLLLSLVREESEARILAASQTDYLTGLPNRRALFERSARCLRAAAETGAAVSVLMFDLDHFKRINDTHGHHAGDDVLRLFGSVLENELRYHDLTARFGGEEFVVIFVGRSREEVRADAQRIAHRFRTEAANLQGGAMRATVSVGLAHGAADRVSLEQLLSEADGALYRAKALGRDRIEQASPLAAVA